VDDPKGWSKAKWGMSETDIQKELPEATEIPSRFSDTGKSLGLRHFKIGSLTTTVTFRFGDKPSEGLISILLLPEFSSPESANREFLTMLKDKYGSPVETSEDERTMEGKIHSWQWLLQTTSIELTFGDFRNPKYNYCLLQ
jgi:hypothetical protein